MKEFFRHFPPELDEKTAIKAMHCKMHEAKEKFKDDDEEYLECLEKLKDMITIYLQEVTK